VPQDFDLDQFKSTYFEECQELLAAAEENLGELQNNLSDVDVEILHAIFRSVHSIKGGAGAFYFSDLVKFSHVFETLLDRLRSGEVAITEPLVDCMLSANDILARLVQAAQDDEFVDDTLWAHVAKQLEAFTKGKFLPEEMPLEQASSVEEAIVVKNTDYNKTPEEEEEQGWGLFLDNMEPENTVVEETPIQDFQPNYKITFVPEIHLLRFANEPLLLARELNTLGQCKPIVDVSRLPELDDIKSDEAYLSWVFELQTDKSKPDIEEVFEFVVDDCELKIEKISTAQIQQVKEEKVETVEAKPEPVIVKEEPPAKIELQSTPSVAPVQSPPAVQPKLKASQSAKDEPKTSTTASSKVSSIRVELDRVDKLVNMVGELVLRRPC